MLSILSITYTNCNELYCYKNIYIVSNNYDYFLSEFEVGQKKWAR